MINPNESPALRDLGRIPDSTVLLAPFVAAKDGTTNRLVEVKPDGSLEDREVKVGFLDSSIGLGGPIMSGRLLTLSEPKPSTLLVGPTGNLGGVAVCPAVGIRPCTDLPLGGSFEASPSGRLLAGPTPHGPAHFTSPSFAHQHGSLSIVEVDHHGATNAMSKTHDAPGFRAVTFGKDGELFLFGDDGVLLGCDKERSRCSLRARLPEATAIPSERGTIATFDGTLRSNGDPVKVSMANALAEQVKRLEAGSPADWVFHTGRSLLFRSDWEGLKLDRLDDVRLRSDERCRAERLVHRCAASTAIRAAIGITTLADRESTDRIEGCRTGIDAADDLFVPLHEAIVLWR